MTAMSTSVLLLLHLIASEMDQAVLFTAVFSLETDISRVERQIIVTPNFRF